MVSPKSEQRWTLEVKDFTAQLLELKRAMDMGRRFIMGGIIVRKERWGLSWRGWLVAGSAVIVAGLLVLLGIKPFLAVTRPVDSRILVVEGWVPQFVILAAAKEIASSHYDHVLTTGGPVSGSGGYNNDYQTEANVGAGRLRNAGVPGNLVQMVPSHVWNRNRTYYSAVALRDWFQDHNLHVDSFNVVTEDAHARRTWLLFQEAFGPDVRVGIISVANPDYDPKYWWRYSDGVRDVSSEALAYVYVKIFFWPPKTNVESGNRESGN